MAMFIIYKFLLISILTFDRIFIDFFHNLFYSTPLRVVLSKGTTTNSIYFNWKVSTPYIHIDHFHIIQPYDKPTKVWDAGTMLKVPRF